MTAQLLYGDLYAGLKAGSTRARVARQRYSRDNASAWNAPRGGIFA